ncbi:MAG TPA: GNAT family N-acetyltransferase [Candidatus Limnocylindrales bacterium]|nr:GNAT family N-acetyltransferase [Candidatus Limnocylindrales bacterium]
MTSRLSATRLVATPVLAASDVDSARFGVPIARAFAASPVDVTAIRKDARKSGVAMVIVRAPASELAVAQAIETAGGRLCDTLVHYARPLDRPIPEQPRPVRRARRDEIDAIGAIAAEAFAGYDGHYHADRRLDRAAADAGYVDWARRSIADALVVEDAGRVAGFLTLERHDTDTEIVLNAIRPDAQGQGLYTALVIGALRLSATLKAARCVVSTQVWNVRAQKVWIRAGFEPTHAVHTFHLWSD